MHFRLQNIPVLFIQESYDSVDELLLQSQLKEGDLSNVGFEIPH